MSKPDFSDLYKFIVSLGMIFISLAIIVPWLFLKESFDILISTSDFNELMPVAQTLILRKQGLTVWLITQMGWVSGTFLFLGLFTVVVGGLLWWQRQVVLDEKQSLEKQKLEHEVMSMTPSEIAHKAVQELVLQDTKGEKNRASGYNYSNMHLAAYFTIEAKASNAIRNYLFSTHRTHIHQRIDKHEVDLLLLAKNNRVYPDGIVEFQYTTQEIQLLWLSKAASRAIISSLAYQGATKRLAKPVVLAFAPRAILEKSNIKELSREIQRGTRNSEIVISFIAIEEIESLKALDWQKQIFPNIEVITQQLQKTRQQWYDTWTMRGLWAGLTLFGISILLVPLSKNQQFDIMTR